jgi:glycosyltransferase involved in cell wall biosynthesis
MRAHRLALAARHFAEVTLVGPVKHRGGWGALPQEPWIKSYEFKPLPKFYQTTVDIIRVADGDVLIAVKPYLSSYGVALLAAECRNVPVILDIDDLDAALVPAASMNFEESMNDLSDPTSLLYLRLLVKATSAASAITVSSTALQKRFGGTLVPHGCPVEQFDPATVDREAARRQFGFSGPVILFPGTRRKHKGLKPLAKSVARISGAHLAVLCRPDDFTQPEWNDFPLIRIPILPYAQLPALLAAADVVAIPQLDSEGARHQMPMKVYDAMAMGKPIVASTVSDLPTTLDGCARLVPPGDVDQLTFAISELLENPKVAQLLGTGARTRCLEKYGMYRVANELLKAVNLAVNKIRK